jgi:hypothetical protein
MSATMQSNLADAFQIAWDYLEAADELGNPERTANHLLDTIEAMIRHGERRPLLLSNKAIASYQRFRAEQGLTITS